MIQKAIVALCVMLSAVMSPVAAGAQEPKGQIERVVRDFLVAFGNRDFAVFVPYFAEDATVFFPPSAIAPLGRIQGRAEIERTFKAIFAAYPPRPGRTTLPIGPQDLLVQEFDGYAVATFHLGSETARQRRTLVVRRIGGAWKIVHLHGSAAGGPS